MKLAKLLGKMINPQLQKVIRLF